MTSIIILTRNRLDYTKKCVKSIRKHTPEPHEIIFVDNGSTDSTVKWLQGQVKENKNYRLLENKETISETLGRNQGIMASQGENLLLLDHDVIVSEGWLAGMLECLNHAQGVGIVGPMTNNSTGIQRTGDASYQSLDHLDPYAATFRERYHHRRIPCRNIAGFCLLFKRTLLEKIGPLDERFSAGQLEDEDFCLRAALANYRNYVAGDVFIHHHKEMVSPRDRKLFEEKWTLGTGSLEGRRLAVLKARELANIFGQSGQMDKAIEALINCIKVIPDDGQIYYQLARLLIESRKFSESWDVVEAMPDAAKEDQKGLASAGYAKEGLGQDDEAKAFAARMLALNETDPAALNLKGVLAFKKGEKDKALNYFQKAILADPGYGDAYTNLGVLYWGLDQKEESLAHLQRGFILSPATPDNSSLYHSIASSLGRFGQAEEDFREACRLYPHHKNLVFLWIDLLLQQGKYDSALLKIEDTLDTFGLDEGTLNAALAVREKVGPLQIETTSKRGALSLCMIVKNEERNLVKCLKSVRDVVDELIVVDTGSTDKTKDIAGVFGAKVFDFPWTGDFSAARNHSLAQAKGDWILILDADEVISSLDFDELKSLIRKRTASPVAYSIVTRNYTNNASAIGWTQNSGHYPEEASAGWVASAKIRLSPRRKDIFFSNPIHELLENSLAAAKITVSACNVVVHHYGKLDMEREAQKGEDYYLLGKIKYESDPANAKYVSELAKQAQVLQKNEEAVGLWLELLALIEADPQSPGYKELVKTSTGDPLSEIYTQLAAAYLLLERYEEALKAANKAMACSIKSKEAIHIYAVCELMSGELSKAHFILEELLKTMPDYPPALYLMAVTFCLEGEEKKARDIFQLLRQKRMLLAPILNKLARQLQARGRKDDAQRIVHATIENEIGDEETKNLIEELQKGQ